MIEKAFNPRLLRIHKWPMAVVICLLFGHIYVLFASESLAEEFSVVPAVSMRIQGEELGGLDRRDKAIADVQRFVNEPRGIGTDRLDTGPHGAERRTGDHLASLLAGITIFTLASLLGMEVINKVPPTLHTPLMSGSNAISGITVVGSIILAGSTESMFASWLGFIATVLAMINVVGGFVVTDRMLAMFRRGTS